MVEVAVEVIQPFVHSYPVLGELGDFTENRLVPGPDGYLVKRPIAFRRIEGFVEFSRLNDKGVMEVVTQGTGIITVPKEVADTLVARGVVRVVDDKSYAVQAEADDGPQPPPRPPRTSRNRPVPVS